MDRIVQNMVYTLAQVESMHPLQTALQISATPPPDSDQHMYDRLWEAGYAIQQIDTSQATLPLAIDYSEESMSSGASFLYSVSAGAVTLSRLYKIIDDQSIPLSAMTIIGAQPGPILSNDDIFNTPVLGKITGVVFETPPTPTTNVNTMALASEKAGLGSQSIADVKPNQANFFDTMQSNYAHAFSGYEDVDTATIIFGDDSLILRRNGKQVIRNLVATINPSTDIISLIGCSNGGTSIPNGNKVLAMGRAERVKEEFLYAGIAKELILDEGCWSAVSFEVMPPRAVVITIKRTKG